MSRGWSWSRALPESRRHRAILRRAWWAVRVAGFDADTLRERVRVTFHAWIVGEERGVRYPLHGFCHWQERARRYVIRCEESEWGMGLAVLHEIAHALLWAIERDDAEEHSPAFDAVLGMLRRAYVDRDDGPMPSD